MTKDAADMAITGAAAEALMKSMTQGQSRKRTTKVRKRKSGFKVDWVKLSMRWIDRLQAAGANGPTCRLAHAILVENYKLDQMAVGEIVLSKEVTGMPRWVRKRATDNLVKLRLIKVKRVVGAATRVVDLFI